MVNVAPKLNCVDHWLVTSTRTKRKDRCSNLMLKFWKNKNTIFFNWWFRTSEKLVLFGKIRAFWLLKKKLLKKLLLINRVTHWLVFPTSTKVWSSPKFDIRFIKCNFLVQFWGIDGFRWKVADFDQIQNFWKMTCHRQTDKTTDKFCIPLRS